MSSLGGPSAMRAWPAVVLGLLAGCDQGECGPGLERVQPLAAPIALTGTPAKLALSIGCAPGVTSVSSEVTDAHGGLVPSTVLSFSSTGGAVIEFTPTEPGPHTVVARFAPSGEEARASSHVMRDRSGEAPVLRFRSAQACGEVLVAGGLALCQSAQGFELISDGGVAARGTPAVLSSAGGALWALEARGVSRWEATDGGLLGAHLPIDATNVLTRLSGTTETGLLLSERGTLFAVRVTAAGGLERASLDFDSDTRMNEGLAVTDAGVLWLGGAEACFAAPGQPRRCREWTPRMLAPEGDGLWLWDDALQEVGFARFADGPAPISLQFLRLPPDAQAQLKIAPLGYPTTRFQDHLVAIDGRALRLDAWKGPEGWDAGGVTATHVWFGGGGDFVVFAR